MMMTPNHLPDAAVTLAIDIARQHATLQLGEPAPWTSTVLPADAALRSGGGQSCLPLEQARAAAAARSPIQGGQQRGEAVLNPRANAQDLQGLISP